MEFIKRFARLMFGLFLLAVGVYTTIKANIGLSPWEALSVGISLKTGLSFGNANLLVGLAVIAADIFLREKIGIGSILNALLVGKIVDFLDWLNILSYEESFLKGLLMLFAGQFILCLGAYFYMGAEFGCGPRDSFMVAFSRRFDRAPIGVIRFFIELSVLVVGFFMGAKVGIGSCICMFGISFMMQITFDALHFNVKALRHEDVADTFRKLKSI